MGNDMDRTSPPKPFTGDVGESSVKLHMILMEIFHVCAAVPRSQLQTH